MVFLHHCRNYPYIYKNLITNQMLKTTFTFLLIVIGKLTFCQTANDFTKGTFTPFPRWEGIAQYISAIKPDSSYLYWKCMYDPSFVPARKHQLIFESGDKKYAKLTKKYVYGSGFMRGCPPGFCKYYIVAVKKDKTVEQINTSAKFRAFIGKVDNIDKVFLLVKDNGYSISPDLIKTGSYQEREDDYLLYLNGIFTDIGDAPHTGTSTKAVLTKSGEFRAIESVMIVK